MEWFTVDPVSGKRTLINADGGIKAYTSAQAPVAAVQLLGSSSVSGTYAALAGAVVDASAKTITIARPSETQFFKISGPSSLTISGVRLVGETVVISYR